MDRKCVPLQGLGLYGFNKRRRLPASAFLPASVQHLARLFSFWRIWTALKAVCAPMSRFDRYSCHGFLAMKPVWAILQSKFLFPLFATVTQT